MVHPSKESSNGVSKRKHVPQNIPYRNIDELKWYSEGKKGWQIMV